MSESDELYLRAMEMLRTPEGTERAMRLLERAALGGHVEAAAHLGKAYELGEHVKRDVQEAQRWHALAAEAGHDGAKESLTNLLLEALASLPDDPPTPPPPSSGPGSFGREEIALRLEKASTAALALARKLVVQELPESVRFILDSGTTVSIFVERGARQLEVGALNDPQALDKAVDWLWYDGHVPMWVNIYAQRVDERHTYLALTRSRGFIATAQRLYHVDEGYPPFHVTGLVAPPGWTSVERDGRFRLGWVYDPH